MKSSGVIILNKDKDILLMQRDDSAPTSPNMWNIIGGTSEGQETPLETALRETEEETGIRYKTEDLKPLRSYTEEELHRRNSGAVSIFLADYPCLYPQKLIVGEGKGIGFFSKEEIAHLRVTPTTKRVVADFFKDYGA